MKTVIIESPFGTKPDGTRCTPAGIERNRLYALAAMYDCLERGEAPFASHLLYTQVYDDATPDERKRGIAAGLAIGALLEVTVVYTDRGITDGMRTGIERADADNRPVEYRLLGLPWSTP